MYSTGFPADWRSAHAQGNKCNAEREHKTINYIIIKISIDDWRKERNNLHSPNA